MKKQLLAGTVAIVAASAGCSAEDLVEKAAEEAIEKGIESETGEDIELDFDLNSEDGSITITGDDGETVINFDGDSEDGSVTITGDDGDATFISGQELVDGWPDRYPLPAGVSILNSSKINDGEGTVSYSTVFEGNISFDDAAATFDAYEDGAEPSSTYSTANGSLRSMTKIYQLGSDTILTVTFGETDDGTVAGSVILIAAPE